MKNLQNIRKFLMRFLMKESSIVNEVIGPISNQFIFLQKDFARTKMQIKPKPTNKTKFKQTKNNTFLLIKTSKREKIG